MNQNGPIPIAIVHIMSANFSGAGKNLLRLIRRIDAEKLDIVLVGQRENELTARVKDLGVKVMIVPYPPALDVYEHKLLHVTIGGIFKAVGGIWQYNASLLKILKRSRIQVVWADNIRTFVFVYAASKMCGCKVIWNIWSEPKGKAAWVLHRLGLLLADCIHLEYNGQASKLFGSLAQSRLFQRKLVTLYTGVTDCDELAGTNVRDELQLSSTDIVILMASNISPAKGQMDLMMAMKAIVQTFSSVHLLIAGRAPEIHPASVAYQAAVKQYASENNLSDKVHFLGWRSDVRDVFSAADIYVSTSYSESFPDAVREAMRAGKPVVVTNVGGTGELVEEGRSGRLFEPGDVESLIRHLSQLTVDLGLRSSMGLEGKRIIDERFSTQVYAQQFQDVVLSLSESR